jgi:hypothetical protein
LAASLYAQFELVVVCGKENSCNGEYKQIEKYNSAYETPAVA